MGKGFTLIEALIVTSLTGIIGLIIVSLLFQTIKGSNKTQIIGVITQNGQSALNIIDQTIRFAAEVVCPAPSIQSPVIAVRGSDGKYYRLKIYPPHTGSPIRYNRNGFITQEILTLNDPTTARLLCDGEISSTTPYSQSESLLTNSALQTGVSVVGNPSSYFERFQSADARDIITIKLSVGPPIRGSLGADSQSNIIPFQTTIVLR